MRPGSPWRRLFLLLLLLLQVQASRPPTPAQTPPTNANHVPVPPADASSFWPRQESHFYEEEEDQSRISGSRSGWARSQQPPPAAAGLIRNFALPETILKDGRIFYRHDAASGGGGVQEEGGRSLERSHRTLFGRAARGGGLFSARPQSGAHEGGLASQSSGLHRQSQAHVFLGPPSSSSSSITKHEGKTFISDATQFGWSAAEAGQEVSLKPSRGAGSRQGWTGGPPAVARAEEVGSAVASWSGQVSSHPGTAHPSTAIQPTAPYSTGTQHAQPMARLPDARLLSEDYVLSGGPLHQEEERDPDGGGRRGGPPPPPVDMISNILETVHLLAGEQEESPMHGQEGAKVGQVPNYSPGRIGLPPGPGELLPHQDYDLYEGHISPQDYGGDYNSATAPPPRYWEEGSDLFNLEPIIELTYEDLHPAGQGRRRRPQPSIVVHQLHTTRPLPTTHTPTLHPDEALPTTHTPTLHPDEALPTTHTPTLHPDEALPTNHTPTLHPEGGNATGAAEAEPEDVRSVGLVSGGPWSSVTLPAARLGGPVVRVWTVSASPADQRPGTPIQPGENIPGVPGYKVPPGFRGHVILGQDLPVEAHYRRGLEGLNTHVNLWPQSRPSSTLLATVSGAQAGAPGASGAQAGAPGASGAQAGAPGIRVTLTEEGLLLASAQQAAAAADRRRLLTTSPQPESFRTTPAHVGKLGRRESSSGRWSSGGSRRRSGVAKERCCCGSLLLFPLPCGLVSRQARIRLCPPGFTTCSC